MFKQKDNTVKLFYSSTLQNLRFVIGFQSQKQYCQALLFFDLSKPMVFIGFKQQFNTSKLFYSSTSNKSFDLKTPFIEFAKGSAAEGEALKFNTILYYTASDYTALYYTIL